MQSWCDIDNNCQNYKCGVCKYLYTEYYNYDKQLQNQEKPFIKLEEPLFYTEEGEKVNQYACPICGVLQVNTSNI